jgi:peptidyl serine alpha-galactosyltransferase
MRKIVHYFRTKRHVWVTTIGMMIVLRLYDQILRSTLVPVRIGTTEPLTTQTLSTSPQKIPKAQNPKMQQQDETVQTQRIAPAAEKLSNVEERQPSYHVVFSTSCSLQQDWESYVFFYHCMRVRQPGNITRIVSGCNDIEAKKLLEFHNKHIVSLANGSIQTFHIHFTPSYGSLYLSEGKYPYKYMNKPYGLRHWMENSLRLSWKDNNTTINSHFLLNSQQQQHQDLLDGVVILMDPDMVLFRPIIHDFSDENILWAKVPRIKKVTHGNPISQQDGYLSNEWMKFNFTFITRDPSIRPPPYSDGPIHWNTGPPYLATVYDMYRIVSLWTETAPRVLEVYPELFAEMYGFVIATVMLQLPFQMVKSIVISTTSATDREGWPFVDALPDRDICHIPVRATSGSFVSSDAYPKLPIGLHYCGIYLLGKVRQHTYFTGTHCETCIPYDFLTPSLFCFFRLHIVHV